MGKSLKIPFYILLFGLLTLIGVLWRQPVKREYLDAEVLGARANLQLFIEPEDGREPVLRAINMAQREILVEVYLLSDPEVIAALKEAEARGVEVKVLLEQHPFGGSGLNQKAKPDLEATGAEVRWSNPSFALTHEKSLAVDGRMVCILNLNLTKSAFEKNREYNICTENQEEVAEVVAIFTADWERKSYLPTTPNLVVSPDNSRGKLTALINSAQKSIDLEIEVLQDTKLIELLAEKAKIIPVRIITPPSEKIAGNKKVAGVAAKTLSSPYVHAKLLLIDGQRAYVGSVNFSQQSLDRNRELGILISQPDVIERLKQAFETDFEAGTPLATP